MFQRSLLLGNRSKLILLIVLILLITLCKSYRLSKFQFDIKKSVVSSSLAILLSISTMNGPGNALIAPLADVGVKEFLVKDGRQWLRLSQPVGNDMKLGSLRKSSPEIEIQESLELPRLRLEQVSLSYHYYYHSVIIIILLSSRLALRIMLRGKKLQVM